MDNLFLHLSYLGIILPGGQMKDISQKIKKYIFIFNRKLSRAFKTCFGLRPFTKVQKKIIDSLEVGDIVYAEMPLSDGQLYNIGSKHRMRPHYIIRKEREVLVTYPLFSRPNLSRNNLDRFELYCGDNPTYQKFGKKRGSFKNSHFHFTNVYLLKPYHLIEKFMDKNVDDMKHLERHLVKRKNANRVPHDSMNIPFPVLVGDVIKYEKFSYLVYKISDQGLFVHPVYHIKRNMEFPYIEVNLGVRKVKVSFQENLTLDESVKSGLITSLTHEELKRFKYEKNRLIYSKQKFYKKNQKDISFRYKVGSRFSYNDESKDWVYLYSINNQHFGYFKKDIFDNQIFIQQIHTVGYEYIFSPIDQDKIILCLQEKFRKTKDQMYQKIIDKIETERD